MLKSLLIALILSLCLACPANTQSRVERGSADRDRDGLIGAVKAILIDDVTFGEKSGAWVESQQASATVIYGAAGSKTLETPFKVNLPGGYAIVPHDLQYNPQAKGRQVEEPMMSSNGSSSGKWVKTYDASGNLIEKARYDANGSMIEKHNIAYEYDSQGNWIKRAATQVIDNGQPSSKTSEASYRLIVYFKPVTSAQEMSQEEHAPASAKQLKNPIAATEANISGGRALYSQRCVACHGENGKAETEIARALEIKPADLTSQTARELTDGEIYWVTTHGIKTSRMPGLEARVGEDERWKIALYIRELQSGRPQKVEGSGQAIAEADRRQRAATPRSTPVPAEQRYKLRGKVISVDQKLRQVTVEHEAIEGYMGAMTMPFPLKDERMSGVLKAGDLIRATLVVADGGRWWLEGVVISKDH